MLLPPDVTVTEVRELAERRADLMVHGHGRKRQPCLAFMGTYERTDDRRMLTALRILTHLLSLEVHDEHP